MKTEIYDYIDKYLENENNSYSASMILNKDAIIEGFETVLHPVSQIIQFNIPNNLTDENTKLLNELIEICVHEFYDLSISIYENNKNEKMLNSFKFMETDIKIKFNFIIDDFKELLIRYLECDSSGLVKSKSKPLTIAQICCCHDYSKYNELIHEMDENLKNKSNLEATTHIKIKVI